MAMFLSRISNPLTIAFEFLEGGFLSSPVRSLDIVVKFHGDKVFLLYFLCGQPPLLGTILFLSEGHSTLPQLSVLGI